MEFSKKHIRVIVTITFSFIALGWTISGLKDCCSNNELALENISITWTIFAFILSSFVYFFRLIRLRYWVKKRTAIFLPITDWIELYLKSVAIAAFTPMRIGDFSRIAFMNKFGLSLKERTQLVLLEKGSDLICLPLALLISAKPIELAFKIPSVLTYSLSVILAVAIVTFLLIIRGKLGAKEVIIGIIISFFSFLSFFSANILFFKASGIGLSMSSVIMVVAVSGILSNLPISFNGLGVREASFFQILTMLDVPLGAISRVILLEFLASLPFPAILYLLWLAIAKLFSWKKNLHEQS